MIDMEDEEMIDLDKQECKTMTYHHSQATKDKISRALLGKKKSVEHIQKIIETKKGFKHSEETKKYISLRLKGVNKGKKRPDLVEYNKKHKSKWMKDYNLKYSHLRKGNNNPMYGKKHSEQTRKKISEIHKSLGTFKKEKNPNWKGGIAFESYTSNFNDSFKQIIKERDGGCLICNIPIEELHLLKKTIMIHHIDYNKLNTFLQNCCTLCNSCHSKTNFNRESWILFFQSLLKQRYNYQYTEDQKIILNFTKTGMLII